MDAVTAQVQWHAPEKQSQAAQEQWHARRLGGGTTTRPTTTRPAADLPDISYADQVLLVKTARRAFRARVTGGPEYGARYRAPALQGLTGMIHLTLRSGGAVVAEAESREMDVVDAAVAVGVLLGEAALEKGARLHDGGDDLGLEFELLGPREYISAGYDPSGTWSEELLHSFEPAVEGIGVEFRGRRGWMRPSEVVSLNYTPDLALQAAESGIGLKHVDKLRFSREIRYFRFRAYHLWQPSAQALPVVLVRGAALVPQERVGPAVLDEAIGRLGAYLHYRQNRDGWFSHEYLPASDRYTEGNAAVVQMRALVGLAAYAAWSGKTEIVADALKGIEKSAGYLRPFCAAKATEEGKPEAAEKGLVLWFPGHEDRLEISAFLLMAMTAVAGEQSAVSDQPSVASSQPFSRLSDQRMGLIEGLLASQDASGRLEMDSRGRSEGGPEDAAAAGWALVALAGLDWPTSSAGRDGAYGGSPTNDQIELVLQRALSYYRGRDDVWSNPVAAAALARAFARAYAQTNDARASAFVFDVLDRFARLQVNAAVCPWPELYGAINVRERGAVGVDTAIYLTALADGVALAERVGDRPRVRRYRGAVSAAVRFVLQLEVCEEGCYYICSPRDALGGVRAAPWDSRIRVDHCAEALMSLMRAREVLYGKAKGDGTRGAVGS
ncbi:MAG: hypothetical protein JXQ75_00295 [Phycisphaerae bacterium]|nr:hypothetical protein [Phycisphaerae bacterium]